MGTKFAPVYATVTRMVVQGQLVELAFALATNMTSFYTLYRQASFRFLIGKQTTAVLQISSLYTYKHLTAMHKADRYNNPTFIIMTLKLIWKKFNGLPKFSIFCVSEHIVRC